MVCERVHRLKCYLRALHLLPSSGNQFVVVYVANVAYCNIANANPMSLTSLTLTLLMLKMLTLANLNFTSVSLLT